MIVDYIIFRSGVVDRWMIYLYNVPLLTKTRKHKRKERYGIFCFSVVPTNKPFMTIRRLMGSLNYLNRKRSEEGKEDTSYDFFCNLFMDKLSKERIIDVGKIELPIRYYTRDMDKIPGELIETDCKKVDWIHRNLVNEK